MINCVSVIVIIIKKNGVGVKLELGIDLEIVFNPVVDVTKSLALN